MTNVDFFPLIIRAVHWRLSQMENNTFDSTQEAKNTFELNGKTIPLFSFTTDKDENFPYAYIGNGSSTDFSTQSSDGLLGNLEVNLFDRSTSAKLCVDFLERVYFCLQNFEFDFSLFNTQSLDYSSVNILNFKLISKDVNLFEKDKLLASSSFIYKII